MTDPVPSKERTYLSLERGWLCFRNEDGHLRYSVKLEQLRARGVQVEIPELIPPFESSTPESKQPSQELCDCCESRANGKTCAFDEISHLRRENVRWENEHKILLSEIGRLKGDIHKAVANHTADLSADIFSVTTGKVERYEQPPKDPIRALVESAYKDGYGGDLTDDRDLSAQTLEMMRTLSRPAAECTRCHCQERTQKLIGDPRVGVTQTTGTNPLDATNHNFRICLKGHIRYSASFSECPSCKVERERPAQPPGDDPADVIMSPG